MQLCEARNGDDASGKEKVGSSEKSEMKGARREGERGSRKKDASQAASESASWTGLYVFRVELVLYWR